MKILSSLPSPAIAGVVREPAAAAAIAEMRNCFADGADMVDLHLSCLDDTSPETLRRILAASRLPVLALHYNRTAEWRDCGHSEDERVELLLRAVDAGAAGIDMQGYTFDARSAGGFYGENRYSFTQNAPREVVTDSAVIEKQCALIKTVHERGAEVLLSCHPGIPMRAEAVVELALFLEQRGPDIIKIVTIARDEDDLIESFRAMHLLKKEVRTKVSYHAGGTAGALSRIVNPMLGGHMIFCVDRYRENSTMEQLDLRTVRSIVDNMRRL